MEKTNELEAIEPDTALIRTEEWDVLRSADWLPGLDATRGSLTDFSARSMAS